MTNGSQVVSLFESLMDGMDIEESKRDALRALPDEQKRVMIMNQTKREVKRSTTFLAKRYHTFSKKFPEYYVRKLSEAKGRVLPIEEYKSLHVSLSTQAIRNLSDLSLEYEVMKCIKSVMNTKFGAKFGLSHPRSITEIAFALESPSLGVRKLATDILAFVCHLNMPAGRRLVMNALNHIQHIRQYDYTYEVWLRHFTLDIWRGGNASEANCNKYDKGSSLLFHEYLESNFIFMNSLIDTCVHDSQRITTRLRMIAAGVRSVILKAKRFASAIIAYQLARFESGEETDHLKMCSAEFDWRSVKPYDMFMATIQPITRTKSHRPFVAILNHLLYAQRDRKLRDNYYRLLESVVEQMLGEDLYEVHAKLAKVFDVPDLAPESDDESLYSLHISKQHARSSSSVLSDSCPRTPTSEVFVEKPLPPPPPTPLEFTMFSKRTPQKTVKKLNWEKLPEYAVEATIWNGEVIMPNIERLSEALEEDGVFEEIEARFAIRNMSASPVFNPKRQAAKQVYLLDRKRSHQIDIMLSSMKHVAPKEICHRFLDSESCISEDTLENFAKCLPTEHEIKLLEPYLNTDDNELGRAEAILLESLRIPQFEEKLKAVYMKTTFHEKAAGMEKSLESITQACTTLRSSKHLAKLFQLILVVGNFMNGKDFRGNARGFKIQSLNRLSDIRANHDSTTLLHFLLNVIENKFPELLQSQTSQLSATQESFNEISTMLCSLRRELNELSQSLGLDHLGEVKSSEDAPFLLEMERFFAKAKARLSELQENLDKTRSTFRETAQFYGENADTMPSENFFKIFSSFLVSFDRTIKDNRAEKKRREELEKRRRKQQEIERRREQQKSLDHVWNVEVASIADDEGGHKGVMDNLLEALRDQGSLSERREKKASKLFTAQRGSKYGLISAAHSSVDYDPLSAKATEILNQILSKGES
ncbi:actin-binding FH2 [Basidiobolus meristosporus CBS 931.73]|uniref:Actin-binding FH2 n=1 Tax=Basidiobolus meristosporus CBS 931.73 TaxID=1314790 RepID=A0A1Y1XT73_9FUNG|nr:actin-binding FH2 [Basidiobolus meristosporus CBS 931.73]|eukprot:ORX88923.1 actin-binding FH2 [Basidiobolus meristosporus CBS 931.73]